MLFFILGGCLLWWVVLTVYLLLHPRTTFNLFRWTLSLYLIIFGWLAGLALQEALETSPECLPARRVLAAWGVWYIVATYAIVNPAYLAPAVVVSTHPG